MTAAVQQTVTLTIDGTDVTVPAGTGLVEAAAAMGVEIPVFCYEPRIGPAVGACRMCLVEIEGMPKLQAACAIGVREGMVVSTVGDKARDAQEAVLEFLLVNHPLDCPVCDKGGECPLQDQAFRWGPGASRFRENKRVGDKPIPVSPLIALDRERCILCYRCSRFSAEVSEDLQLISRQRGADSVIATFEGRAWEGHHSGNVIELCPVGALTSTQFRFTGRPWETTDHPSIAPWDPCGSNVYNTVREGRVVRVLSRRNDSVDVGWIDDRTRFAYTSMYGPARVTVARQLLNRDRPMGNRPHVDTTIEVALEWLHAKLRVAMDWKPDPELDDSLDGDAAEQIPPARELWVLSGAETLETVHAVQQLTAQTGGSVVAAPGASAAAPAGSARIEDLGLADNVVVVGHADLLDTAPALDLWIRKARQRGAAITVVGMGGTRLQGDGVAHIAAGPGQLDAGVEQACTQLRESGAAADRSSVVIYRDGELTDASIAAITQALGLPRQGSGLLAIPAAPNARGLAALGVECITPDELFAHTGGVVYLSVDPERIADRAIWGPSIKRAAWVVAVDALPTPLHAAADYVIPGVWGAEQDGTMVNLEGRLQRMTVGAAPPDGVRTPLRWIAGIARRLGGAASGHAAGAYRELAAIHGAHLPAAEHGAIPTDGVLGVHGGPTPAPTLAHTAEIELDRAAGELALYIAPNLYDSAEVAHADDMSFLTADARITMNRADARAAGLSRGSSVLVELDGRSIAATLATSTRIAPGHARTLAGTPGFAPGRTGWSAARVTSLDPATAPTSGAAEAATAPAALIGEAR